MDDIVFFIVRPTDTLSRAMEIINTFFGVLAKILYYTTFCKKSKDRRCNT